jgi:hypothetical protein
MEGDTGTDVNGMWRESIEIVSFHIVYIASGVLESGIDIGLANEFCFAIDGSVSHIDGQGVFFWQA